METGQVTVTVQILGKEYTIACGNGEKEALLASAKYLNDKVRDIKNAGRVVGSEKVVVMAALNIAHELLQQKNEERAKADALRKRLHNLQECLAVAIDDHSQFKM